MFDCKMVDEPFLETAKARGSAERTMAVSAGQLFAALEDGPSWSKWVPIICGARWTSPMPMQHGSTRTVSLLGGGQLHEAFWAWEPGRRIGFCVSSTTAPWLCAVCECYDITPLDDARCTLRWRMGIELRGPLRIIEARMRPWLAPAMQSMLAKLEPVAAAFPRALLVSGSAGARDAQAN